MYIRTSLVKCIFGITLMAGLLGLQAPQPAPAASPQQDVTYHLEGEEFGVISAEEHNHSPAVAYSPSSEMDLVVWEYDMSDTEHVLLARFTDHNIPGDITSYYDFALTDWTQGSPAVAYDFINDRFLVVWVENYCVDFVPQVCADVIRGQLTYAYPDDEEILIGEPFMIAADIRNGEPSFDYGSPAIAFNEQDGVFSVVFTRRSQDPASTDVNLYAQMIEADESEPLVLGPAEGMVVRDTAGRVYSDPAIAWSDELSETFLIASTVYNADTAEYYAAVFYMLDVYQLIFPQFPGGWKIAPYDEGSYPLTGNCSKPSVAYDPLNQAFVVAFRHEEPARRSSPDGASPDIGEVYTIYGQRVRPVFDENDFTYDGELAFPIETDLDSLPGTSYDEVVIRSAGLPGELALLTQVSYLQVPEGTSYWLNFRSLSGTSAGPALQAAVVDIGGYIGAPDLTCTGGACLAVWAGKHLEVDALSVFGQHLRADCYNLDLIFEPACPGCLVSMANPPACFQGGHSGVLELEALADGDYFFSHWTGDVYASGNPLVLLMDEDKQIHVNYMQGTAQNVLFDESHEQANTLDWTRAQELNPEHPEWIYFGRMAQDLSNQFTFTRNVDEPLALALLQAYDLLVLAVPHNDFTAEEQQAIHDYITLGGGVVVLGDCGMVHPANEFLDEYDILFEEHCLFSPAPDYDADFWVTELWEDAPFDSIPSYFTNWPQFLPLGEPVLAWSDEASWVDFNWSGDYDAGEETGPLALGAAYDGGCGRLVAFADNAFQDDYYDTRVNTPFMRAMLTLAGGGQACEIEQNYQTFLPFLVRP